MTGHCLGAGHHLTTFVLRKESQRLDSCITTHLCTALMLYHYSLFHPCKHRSYTSTSLYLCTYLFVKGELVLPKNVTWNWICGFIVSRLRNLVQMFNLCQCIIVRLPVVFTSVILMDNNRISKFICCFITPTIYTLLVSDFGYVDISKASNFYMATEVGFT